MKTAINIDFSLYNVENYKPLLEASLNDVLDKYISLIYEYLKFVVENIKLKNKTHLSFIIIRGLETITNVFNNILFYTKNLPLSYYHSQTAFYYYVEFIGQITDEQHVFLQLSSRDATMYVYKKTIFEISSENRKLSTYIDKEIMQKLDDISACIEIYKYLINYLFTNSDNISKDFTEEMVVKFEKLCRKTNAVLFNKTQLDIILLFIENLNSKTIPNNKYLEIMELFFKKISKNVLFLNDASFKVKFLDSDYESMLNLSTDKFIAWMLS